MNPIRLSSWDSPVIDSTESADSRLKYLFLVRSGEPGGRPGKGGWRNPVDYDLVEDRYEPHFEKLGSIIREKISPVSPVHIACSTVGVGQQTAYIIQSQLEGKGELEITSCLGHLTEKIDKWNWAGDFGYNSRDVTALVERRRKEAEALILIGGINVVKSYPGTFNEREYNLQGRDIPPQLLPLYFGGLPHGYAWMLDLQKREWTVLPGPVKMYNEGCRQHRSTDPDGKRNRALKAYWEKRKAAAQQPEK